MTGPSASGGATTPGTRSPGRPRVAVVDCGGANLGSLRFALDRLDAHTEITADPDTIRAATHVILPGVGHARAGMDRIRQRGLVDVLKTLEQPLLGICLGMQLLHERSEEGDTPCLGLLSGVVRRIPDRPESRVPHMGWNVVQPTGPDGGGLLQGLGASSYMYFVHSFAVSVGAQTIGATQHGQERFASVVGAGQVLGVQFHPERSGSPGRRLLQNFLGGGAP